MDISPKRQQGKTLALALPVGVPTLQREPKAGRFGCCG
jgi:hypothetical protein